MKAELLKRLFKAIASADTEAIETLTNLAIAEERKQGHTILAQQLEQILKNTQKIAQAKPINPKIESSIMGELKSLGELTNAKYNLPLVTVTDQAKLRHLMVLPVEVEKRLQRIEKEYAARNRLAHYGLPYRKKILLYGPPGCGKTLSAERLAWNTGLTLVKVRFETMVSSLLGETANNLRKVFADATKNPCLLFLDECDSIAKSRDDSQEIGEIKRVVNTFLQILDEYDPTSGLLVAATNLTKSLDVALWRRFDDLILMPLPGPIELEIILKQTLATITIGTIDWPEIITKMHNFSAAQVVKVGQDAAKRAILDREGLVIQEHLEQAIKEIQLTYN